MTWENLFDLFYPTLGYSNNLCVWENGRVVYIHTGVIMITGGEIEILVHAWTSDTCRDIIIFGFLITRFLSLHGAILLMHMRGVCRVKNNALTLQ